MTTETGYAESRGDYARDMLKGTADMLSGDPRYSMAVYLLGLAMQEIEDADMSFRAEQEAAFQYMMADRAAGF